MNILTKNRILQEGDEMLSGGVWGPVPADQWGLQIEFSKHAEKQIRRPSETESSMGTGGTPAPTESKPARAEVASAATETAESKPAVPTPAAPKPLSETYPAAKPKPKKTLPTVVSAKAHKRKPDAGNVTLTPVVAEEIKKVAKETTKAIASGVSMARIPYTDLSALPNWIGRNGTFKAKAIHVTAQPNGLIQLRPEGVRGLAKNALIEIPAADIPMLVDFLMRHSPTAAAA